VGFIGGAKPWGRERVSGLIICDHQMEQVDISWLVEKLEVPEILQTGKQAGKFGKWSFIRGSGFTVSLGNFHPPQECQPGT
jgi:hypothetical protein